MTNLTASTRVGWWRLLLAAVAAVLVSLLGITSASAATAPILETRVGASTVAGQVVVGPHESIAAGQQWGNAPPAAETVAATGVAANSESALADASSAAFKAADGAAAGWAPSAKHLAGAGGRWQKFAEGADPAALVQEALRSPGASFLPDKTAGRFIVEMDLGRSIGTMGETWLKVVVSDGGNIITSYPVKR